MNRILISKNNRFAISIMLLLFVILGLSATGVAAASEDIRLEIDGETVVGDVPPILENGRVLVPVRIISETLGAQVDYISASREVIITTDTSEVKLTINKKEAYINNNEYILDVPAKIVNSRTMVPIRFVSEALGAEVHWIGESRTVVIESHNRFMGIEAVEQGENFITYKLLTTKPISYREFTLENPDRLVIDVSDLVVKTSKYAIEPEIEQLSQIRWSQFTQQPYDTRIVFEGAASHKYEFKQSTDGKLLVTFDITKNAVSGKKIVIDPGHGGRDPGARSSSGLRESDVVLEVGLELANMLERAGAEVYLTRDSDVYLSLPERAQMANDISADIFVSIHANAAANTGAKGTETYYHHTPRDPRSSTLARELQRSLVEELNTVDRGVKQANFHVIRETNMASVLVELGFLTNAEDEAMMRRGNFSTQAARALFDGIESFYTNE